MALSQISIPADTARDKKAAELAKTAHLWHTVTLRKDHGSFKAGDRFRQTPNGYRVNAVVCECPDYKRGHVCKHIRAIVLMEAEAARFTAFVDAALGPPSNVSRYDQIMPGCIDCGDLADGFDKRCSKCASDAEWNARRDAQRQRVEARYL